MDRMSDTHQSIPELQGNSGMDCVSSTYPKVSIQVHWEILILSETGWIIPKKCLNGSIPNTRYSIPNGMVIRWLITERNTKYSGEMYPKWSSSWESCNGSHVIHTSIKSSISWEFFIWLHWESRFLVVPGLKPRDMHLRSNQIQNSLRIPELIAVCLTCDQLLQNQILLKLVGKKVLNFFSGSGRYWAWVLGSGYWVLGTRYWLLGTGYQGGRRPT